MDFVAEREAKNIISWIKERMEETGGKTVVIGLSGGKDSTITAALCERALGRENVFGVIIPNGDMSDIRIAWDVAKRYCGRYVVKNIEHEVMSIMCNWYKPVPERYEGDDYAETTLGHVIEDTNICDGSEQAIINMPARLRMVCLYWVAQTIGHGRVMNTCNLSEDWVGYATRYGDGAGDFAPLGQYTVTEVKAIGHYLGVPAEYVEKTPSDGLQDKTDEDNLGFTYAVLDKYIRTGECEDKGIKEKIDRLHKVNLFKLQPIPVCKPWFC